MSYKEVLSYFQPEDFFYSCKELEDPISTASQPVFYLNGKLNTDSLKFSAGDSTYYHFTRHQKDILSVYEFSSEFKRQDTVLGNL